MWWMTRRAPVQYELLGHTTWSWSSHAAAKHLSNCDSIPRGASYSCDKARDGTLVSRSARYLDELYSIGDHVEHDQAHANACHREANEVDSEHAHASNPKPTYFVGTETRLSLEVEMELRLGMLYPQGAGRRSP